MRIIFRDHVIEVPPEAAAVWAMGTFVSPLDLIRMVHWAQHFSMPGRAVGDALRLIDATIQQLRANETVVDDPRLLQVLRDMLPALEAFSAAAWKIRAWEDSHVPKKVRTAHNKAAREHGPQIPPWGDHDEFKAILAMSSSAFALYLDALPRADRLIRELLPPDAPYTDQLDRAMKQLALCKIIVTQGYTEAYRKATVEMGYPMDENDDHAS